MLVMIVEDMTDSTSDFFQGLEVMEQPQNYNKNVKDPLYTQLKELQKAEQYILIEYRLVELISLAEASLLSPLWTCTLSVGVKESPKPAFQKNLHLACLFPYQKDASCDGSGNRPKIIEWQHNTNQRSF